MTQAYPLEWPEGWRRTPPHKRKDGRPQFQKRGAQRHASTTVNVTRQELTDELQWLGARNIILSTNVELRIDGKPYSSRRNPDDPGIAVYFELDGDSMVMAQDAFERVPDNIRSMTLAISGMRQMQRHGVGTMLKRAFSGFTALPPPEQMSGIPTPEMWWEVLGVAQNCPLAVAHGAYKALARTATEHDLLRLNLAIETAKRSEVPE